MTEADTGAPLSDAYYMGLAIRRAKEAAVRGEVPVGAIVVIDGELYSSGGNAREERNDPTAHAEVLAIRHAAEMCESWRLETATMYVTVEPCLLCTGAILLSRIRRVVYGCANPKGGALRFAMEHRKTLGLNHEVEIVPGVAEFECAQLLKEFFKEKRAEKRRDGRVVEGA
jgi:tRNA(adenine34) deaminase